MAAFDSNILKLAPDAATPAYRTAPHNIEAERGLLGAILVNNDAFYRVSDFLEPKHFFAPIHQTIYETAGSLIRAGKLATPVTLKTFVPADTDIGGMTVSQYLARLAAEATTIINALDYGRTTYEQALRRDLIHIGEDMVNVAYDAPVDFAPRAQIEDAERRLYELAESGRYDGGFQKFSQAMKIALDMAANAYSRDGKLSGVATGLRDLDSKMGGLQPFRPDHRRRQARHGQDRARDQHRLQHRQGLSVGASARWHEEDRQWRDRGLLLLRNVGRATGDAYSRRADQHRLQQYPPRRHHPERVSRRSAITPSNWNTCRSTSTKPAACRSRSSRPAPAA